MKDIQFTIINIPDPYESFQEKNYQKNPIDYRNLINKP